MDYRIDKPVERFDLHMHSQYSNDGELSPEELVKMADEKKLQLIALCDHDETKGIRELEACAKAYGIEVLPAIECSTNYGDDIVHVLGYGINPEDPYLSSLSKKLKAEKAAVFKRRYERMKEKYGFEARYEDIMEKAGGKSPWFVLIDMILKEEKIQKHPDFQDYLSGGSRSEPAAPNFYWDRMQAGSDLYVPAYNPDIFETIDRIHEAGGLAFVAHPFHTFDHQEEKLQKLVDYGLDGLEAYSNYHCHEMNEYYRALAEKMGLLISCGSDFHGKAKPKIEMGDYGLEDGEEKTAYIQKLLLALAQKQQD